MSDAQRLIALSLGKIAMSRQQRGGINLHKNLLVASVLHKARTTYMMDNFQTLIANRKVQAEREAAAKMVTDVPVTSEEEEISSQLPDSTMDDQVVPSRGVTDSDSRLNECGAPSGDNLECARGDKENCSPRNVVIDSTANPIQLECNESVNNVNNAQSNNKRSCFTDAPLVTGKQPLTEHNDNIDQDSNQLSSCRCSGSKRKRSQVDYSDSLTRNKRLRVEYDSDSCDSDNESEADPLETKDYESMQAETTQVTNLVDIFNSGFSGLYKDTTDQSVDSTSNGHTGQINVYVSTDRPISGSQFVLKDLSCATQIKDTVSIPTAIALAV